MGIKSGFDQCVAILYGIGKGIKEAVQEDMEKQKERERRELEEAERIAEQRRESAARRAAEDKAFKDSLTPEQLARVETLERDNANLRAENAEIRGAYDDALGRMSQAEDYIRNHS